MKRPIHTTLNRLFSPFFFSTQSNRGEVQLWTRLQSRLELFQGKPLQGRSGGKKVLGCCFNYPCLPSSVNHFPLWWALRSRYYSNYPKQKNSRGEKEATSTRGIRLWTFSKPKSVMGCRLVWEDLCSKQPAGPDKFRLETSLLPSLLRIRNRVL